MIDLVFFPHSSSQRADDRLRLPEAAETHTAASWRSGEIAKGMFWQFIYTFGYKTKYVCVFFKIKFGYESKSCNENSLLITIYSLF